MYNLGPGIKLWDSLARSPQSSFPLHAKEATKAASIALPSLYMDKRNYNLLPEKILIAPMGLKQKGPWSLKVEE